MADIVFLQALDTLGQQQTPRVDPILKGFLVNGAGQWTEIARQGRVFGACSAVAGTAPGTAIGTTAALALYNPQNSGVDLAVMLASAAYVSGTLGLGIIDWLAHDSPTQTAFSGGTVCTAIGARVDGAYSAKGVVREGATVPAAGKVMRLFGNIPPSAVTDHAMPLWKIEDRVDGAILIAPGCGVSLQATAGAGTSPLLRYSIAWAEVPSVR
jgi:hypothetical protein